jgi:hypothetical protein
MVLIAHRGNVSGKNPEKENSPLYIESALNQGFDVEIDVWVKNEKYYLGHDEPIYNIEESFLVNEKVWCHAKNIEALYKMLNNSKINCFWHQDDDFTLTSSGFIWTYPGKPLTEKSICVLPGLNEKISKCYGICSDTVYNFKT